MCPRWSSDETTESKLNLGLTPEPVFLGLEMVLGAMEKILYRVCPGAPLGADKRVLMGQARLVQDLSLLAVDLDLELPTHLQAPGQGCSQ